jgi:hypothetical protein
MKVNLVPFQSNSRHKFWCNDCDRHIIDSNDSNTGSFFKVDGHEISRSSSKHEGRYTTVMFAICKVCLTELS